MAKNEIDQADIESLGRKLKDVGKGLPAHEKVLLDVMFRVASNLGGGPMSEAQLDQVAGGLPGQTTQKTAACTKCCWG